MKDLFSEPGIYEFDPVAVQSRVVPQRFEQSRVRVVTEDKAYTEHAKLDIHNCADGSVEIRSVEGRLIIEPHGNNEIVLRVKEWS